MKRFTLSAINDHPGLTAFISSMLFSILLIFLLNGCGEGTDYKDLNYGKSKWGMNPVEVAEAYDYARKGYQFMAKGHTKMVYFMEFKNMPVQSDYFYTYQGRLCMIHFQFGHLNPIRIETIGPFQGIVHGQIKRESPTKMKHFFKLLVAEYKEKYGKGKGTDESKGKKLDLEHVWESKTAKWTLYLETNQDGVHQLKLTGFHKEFMKEFDEGNEKYD